MLKHKERKCHKYQNEKISNSAALWEGNKLKDTVRAYKIYWKKRVTATLDSWQLCFMTWKEIGTLVYVFC